MDSDTKDEIIAKIVWSVDDLKEAFIKAKVEPTEDNISRFVQDAYACRTLEEVSIQYGWTIFPSGGFILANLSPNKGLI